MIGETQNCAHYSEGHKQKWSVKHPKTKDEKKALET